MVLKSNFGWGVQASGCGKLLIIVLVQEHD